MNPPSQGVPSAPQPQIYFNGFAISAGNSDFSISLFLDNQPIVKLKASYTVAKTLFIKLQDVVTHFEKTTDHPLMTTDEVLAKLNAAFKDKDAHSQK